MNLRGITITGADDQVEPRDLVSLSLDYPMVEWGILRSEKRRGTPRCPSDKWIREFYLANWNWPIRTAHHLCGSYARHALEGLDQNVDWADNISARSRIQLNGYTQFVRGGGALNLRHWTQQCYAIILQCTDAAAVTTPDLSGSTGGSEIQTLFDPSGGRGVPQVGWPNFGRPCGYAGGIGPNNVAETIYSLEALGIEYWIDMESGVRTDDRFDLGKVKIVLERSYRAAEECR